MTEDTQPKYRISLASHIIKREYPPVDWLIPNLFAKGDQILLAGATGLGKSLVSLLLAVSAVTGRQFANLGIEPMTMEKQMRAFYLDAEMPESVMAERLQRTHMHEDEEYFLNNLMMMSQVEQEYRFDLTDEDSRDELVTLTNIHNIDLAVIDNIFSVMSLKSFNDPEEYIRHLKPLLFDFRRNRTTGLFVDHLNRSEELYGNITKQIHFDTIIRLTKDDDGIFELEFRKNRRLGLHDEPMTFRIDSATNVVTFVSKDGKADLRTFMENNFDKYRNENEPKSVTIDKMVKAAKNQENEHWHITDQMIDGWKHNPDRFFGLFKK